MKKPYRHQSLEASENTLASILEIIREGVWDWDALTGHVTRSAGWFRMLGYEVDCFDENVLTWENVIHPDDYARVMAHFEAYIKGRSGQYRIEYRCVTAKGGYRWIEDTGRIVACGPDGKVQRMVGAHLDIDDAKRAAEKLDRQNALLRHDNATLENLVKERTAELAAVNKRLSEQLDTMSAIASYDRLTSVYNRYMFDELLQKEIGRSKRYERPMGLIMIDVDFFKKINDRYGHQTGDVVLAELAGVLKQSVRSTDIVARWGGEEFVIILPDTRLDQAEKLADNLRKRVEGIIFEKEITLTCSFGVTALREGDTFNALLNRIDTALYRAKGLERNNVQCE